MIPLQLFVFQDRIDTAAERREAISIIGSKSSVLTTNDLVPHLSRRRVIALTSSDKLTKLEDFDEVLLDKKYPGWQSSIEIVDAIVMKLKSNPSWTIQYEKGPIILFSKSSI